MGRLEAASVKDYLHSLRYSFLLSLLLFLTSLFAGYSISEQFPVSILEIMRETFVGIEEWNLLWLFVFILVNNSVKSFFVILLGFTLGIVPVLFIVINGFILGLIYYEVAMQNGLSFALAATLPHGVIEIPMVLLSSAIGVKIGYETVKKIKGEGSIKKELVIGIKFFAFRILPLLLLAAVIEAFLTPFILYSSF